MFKLGLCLLPTAAGLYLAEALAIRRSMPRLARLWAWAGLLCVLDAFFMILTGAVIWMIGR